MQLRKVLPMARSIPTRLDMIRARVYDNLEQVVNNPRTEWT